jgi:hypothetical protein
MAPASYRSASKKTGLLLYATLVTRVGRSTRLKATHRMHKLYVRYQYQVELELACSEAAQFGTRHMLLKWYHMQCIITPCGDPPHAAGFANHKKGWVSRGASICDWTKIILSSHSSARTRSWCSGSPMRSLGILTLNGLLLMPYQMTLIDAFF